METVITASKIAAMAVTGLLSFGVPVLLLLVWRKRTHAKWSAALCGAATFIVFAMLLEGAMHRVLLLGNNGFAAFINEKTWAYVLYAALAAGLFEETGRFVAFKWLLRRQNEKATSVMYGIGHGGIEAMLIAGVAAIVNLVFAISLNTVGLDAMMTSAGLGPGADAIRQTAEQMMNTGAGLFLTSGIERLIAITVHISLSVLVFMAVKRKNRLYLYPVAVLLHAGVDAFAALYQRGILTSIVAVEVCIALVTALIACFAWRLYRQDDAQPEPAGGASDPAAADDDGTPRAE